MLATCSGDHQPLGQPVCIHHPACSHLHQNLQNPPDSRQNPLNFLSTTVVESLHHALGRLSPCPRPWAGVCWPVCGHECWLRYCHRKVRKKIDANYIYLRVSFQTNISEQFCNHRPGDWRIVHSGSDTWVSSHSDLHIYLSTRTMNYLIDQTIFLRLISCCSYPMQCHFCICNPWGAGEVASLASAAATAGPLTAHHPPTDTGTPPPPEYGQWQFSDLVMLSTLLNEKFKVEEGSYEGHKLPWDYQLEQLFHFSLCGGVEVKKKVSKHLSVLNHWFICQCEK